MRSGIGRLLFSSWRRVVILAAVLAAFMGGSAVAASRWVITSKSQIKPSVLHQLKGNRGPRGFRGPQGPTGATGATGPAGPKGLGQVVQVDGPSVTLAPGQDNFGISDNANCPAGDVAVGTGFDVGGVMRVGFVEAFGSFVGGFVVNDSSISAQYNWQAICAPSATLASLAQAHHPSLRSLKVAAHRKWEASR